MKDLTGSVTWPELQALAKEKGLAITPQTIGRAVRERRVKKTGPSGHRRYTWKRR